MAVAEVTSIVLYYNRPDNVARWMDGLKKQGGEIWVWDNSGDYPSGSGEDLLIRSTDNLYCLPRVLLTGNVKTKYTFWQDDDKAINRPDLFDYLINKCEEAPEKWIGWNGRQTAGISNWEKAYSYPGGGFVGKMDGNADIVNTGVSFFRTELINQLPLNPFTELKLEEYKYGDDIWISNNLNSKRVVADMESSFDDLPEGNGLSKQPTHMSVRDKLVRRFYQ